MPGKQATGKSVFSKHFLWGAATSAYQVEGGLHNQWTVWELENARTLAAQAPYRYGKLENWERLKPLAVDPNNYVSGRAANHYELYEKDFDLLSQMNMNAYRFSIEWSRIQPEKDAWDNEAVAHYQRVLAALERRGIEPIVTLFHFTLPVWFAEMGGFEKAQNIKYFVTFATRILEELGPTVRYVVTLNEPEVYAEQGYFLAVWPPQVRSQFRMRRVMLNLAIAHNTLARRIHRMSRRYKVSIAKNSPYIYPGDDSWLSRRVAGWFQFLQDDYFLRQVVRSCDYIGVNFYFSERVYGYRVHNADERMSDIGWDMQPADIEHALVRLSEKYKKPILITENGVADATDTHRQWWIEQTLIGMQRAMVRGVQLLGYLHWSLLDNIELDKGRWPRFGLVAVDYRTMKRTLRPSARWFGKVIGRLRGNA